MWARGRLLDRGNPVVSGRGTIGRGPGGGRLPAPRGGAGFEPELLQFLGAPAVFSGAHVGALVFTLGVGELLAQVGDPLLGLDQVRDGLDARVQEGAGLIAVCSISMVGMHPP